MKHASLKQLLDTFVDFLSTEKGYSDNTCRAYANDLEDFIAYFLYNRALAVSYEDDGDKEYDAGDVASISGLMIRGYLGVLHKQKIKKTSVARKLSAIRSFFKIFGAARGDCGQPRGIGHYPETGQAHSQVFDRGRHVPAAGCHQDRQPDRKKKPGAA